MLTRQLHALRSPLLCADEFLSPRVRRSALRLRLARAAPYMTRSDPPNFRGPSSISMAHPMDPSNQPGPSQAPSPPPAPSNPPPTADASSSTTTPSSADATAASTPQSSSDASVPARYMHPPVDPHAPLPHLPTTPPSHTTPPFNTHKFVRALEGSDPTSNSSTPIFPTPIARNLMRATRALLVDRIGRVKRDALTVQDLESVSRVAFAPR